MTALLEGAKRLVGRGTGTGARVEALREAASHARGRLDDAVVDEADAVVERAAGRLRLSADHTVVAIAGATGSGKSSTFNALTGLELSAVGVRRPTTSWATACVWGSEGAEELLAWLGIPARHQVTRDSMLGTVREDRDMQGVVLLDLPDHDSTEVSHHLEVDRLVQLADLLVWVLDPQKYADAAIHDRYRQPLAAHQDVMVVALNHLDTVPEDRRAGMLDDVRRLLAADGLDRVPVIGVSARQGWGLDELRAEVVSRVRDKKAARARLEADVRTAAQALDAHSGEGAVGRGLTDERVDELEEALADAAGVPTVVEAVGAATRRRAGRATGWPLVSWTSRLRPDPLKRLHLDVGDAATALRGRDRSSVPAATPVQRARVDAAVRAVADDASRGMGRPWVESVRRASTSRLGDVGDRLDAALTSTDLGVAKLPAWVHMVRVLQWLLLAAALVGAVWLGLLAVGDYLRLGAPEGPETAGLPLPTLLLLGGAAAGVVLAVLARALVGLTARGRARRADARLRAAVHEVAQELVVAPIEAEVSAHRALRGAVATVLKG